MSNIWESTGLDRLPHIYRPLESSEEFDIIHLANHQEVSLEETTRRVHLRR